MRKPIIINGKETGYKISDMEDVFNLKTIERGTIGTYRNGYRRIQVNGNTYSVHRLVWEAFNGEIPIGYVIDHIDGNRNNNASSNLHLVTQSENTNSAQRNGHNGQVRVKQYDSMGNFIKEYTLIQKRVSQWVEMKLQSGR